MWKLYRKLFELVDQGRSKLRILHLKIKYPRLSISGSTYIGKNCRIVCVDSAELILNNAHISDGIQLISKGKSKIIVSNSFIGPNSIIVSLDKIIIEDNCAIAEMVTIRDQNHEHNLSDNLMEKQGYDTGPIIIHSNVWLGAKVTVLKNVEIGKNSIIGAHSVVNKSVEENSVYAGIPAKKIK